MTSDAKQTLEHLPRRNKYNFSEPYLIYDMVAEVTHEGNVFTETLVSQDDTLKTKAVFVPWH